MNAPFQHPEERIVAGVRPPALTTATPALRLLCRVQRQVHDGGHDGVAGHQDVEDEEERSRLSPVLELFQEAGHSVSAPAAATAAAKAAVVFYGDISSEAEAP